MLTLAIIIEDGGEVYTPIFERLEQELAALDRRDSVVDRARQLVRASKSTSIPPSHKTGEF